ncbi:hypothetical protein BU16DRAFT_592829 [Lophium mytilinum]|uniref:Uncharacterized protein n=1 Tax=Lophium mytilinum TaxID=390894 RepID=A0A6A6QKX7_9PEZI|nr:hypothetical protein BU16DRAFT_592829 [Lophium mytilinum]
MLQLTYESDRLPAIASIVERMMRIRKGDSYFAGMWKTSLLGDLAWVSHDGGVRPRPSTYAPFWSWAASSGGIDWEPLCESKSPTTQVVDINYTAVGPPHLGEVRNASITLRGSTFTATYSRLKYGRPQKFMIKNIYPACEVIKVRTGFYGPEKDYDYSTSERPVKSGDPVTVLFLGFITPYTLVGIVLRSSSETEFERLGLLQLDHVKTESLMKGPADGPKAKAYEKIVNDHIASLPIQELRII